MPLDQQSQSIPPKPPIDPSRIVRVVQSEDDFAAKLARVEQRMAAAGHPILRVGGSRTAEQQQALYRQGRGAPGPIVTNADGITTLSRHQTGDAADFAFNVNGQPSWDESNPWDLLGRVAKEEGLEWGGDFQSLPDRPHLQAPQGQPPIDPSRIVRVITPEAPPPSPNPRDPARLAQARAGHELVEGQLAGTMTPERMEELIGQVKGEKPQPDTSKRPSVFDIVRSLKPILGPGVAEAYAIAEKIPIVRDALGGAVQGAAGLASGATGAAAWTGLVSDKTAQEAAEAAEVLTPELATRRIADDPAGTLGNPEWWATMGGQAAGSMLGLGTVGTLTKAFTAMKYAPAVAAAIAESLVEGGSTYTDAIRAGATPEDAGKAAAVVTSVNLPLLGFTNVPVFKGFTSEAAEQAARATLARRAARVAGASVSEAGQESAQQIASNVAAQQVYDPSRSATEGVLESAVVGGLAGGGMRAVSPDMIARPGPSAPAPASEPQTTPAPAADTPIRPSSAADMAGQTPIRPVQPSAPFISNEQPPTAKPSDDVLAEAESSVTPEQRATLKSVGWSDATIDMMAERGRIEDAIRAIDQPVPESGTTVPGSGMPVSSPPERSETTPTPAVALEPAKETTAEVPRETPTHDATRAKATVRGLDDSVIKGSKRVPFPVVGLQESDAVFKSGDMDRAALRDVPLDQIVMTQPSVETETVEAYLDRSGESERVPRLSEIAKTGHSPVPMVYEHGGKYYVSDGAHRLVGEWAKGRASARMLVVPAAKPPRGDSLLKPEDATPASDVSYVDPKSIAVDASRFQFKSDADSSGVTREGRIAGPWNENLAGIVLAWKDPESGKTFVVNGHHRLDAAKRLGATRVLVRFIDAKDAGEARVLGALANIAEDKGTPVDAAKVLRSAQYSPERLAELGIPKNSRLSRQGMALANLSDPIFQKVATGEIEDGIGVAIGEANLSPENQADVLTLIARHEAKGGREVTPRIVAALIEDVRAEKSVSRDTDQPNMFAALLGESRDKSVAVEKAELRDRLMQALSRDQRLFAFVAKRDRAEKLGQAGNRINVKGSEAEARQAAEVASVVERLAQSKGPVSDALTKAAERLAAGDSLRAVEAVLHKDVREAVQRELAGTRPAQSRVRRPRAGDVRETREGRDDQAREDVAPKAEQPEPRKFASTQINLPPAAADAVRRLGAMVQDVDLAEDGREDSPHVTVKYGLHSDDPAPVQSALSGARPLTLELGPVDVFPASESGKADVVYVSVKKTPDLVALNKAVAESGEVTDTHPAYTPHVTIAYVKPGAGAFYAKRFNEKHSLDGRTFAAESVEFSPTEGEKTQIPLAQRAEAPAVDKREAARDKIRADHEAGRQQIRDLAERFERDGYLYGTDPKNPSSAYFLAPSTREGVTYQVTHFTDGEPTGHIDYRFLGNEPSDQKRSPLDEAVAQFRRLDLSEPPDGFGATTEPTAPEPRDLSFTASNLQQHFGITQEQAEASVALADAMGLPREKIRFASEDERARLREQIAQGQTPDRAIFGQDDLLDTGEVQPRLPDDVGAVRDVEIEQPKLGDLGFNLEGQAEDRRAVQETLFGAPVKPTRAKAQKPRRFEQDALFQEGPGTNAIPRTSWYYSNTLKALETWQKKGTADQLLAHLKKHKGAMDEAEAIGLTEWLKAQEGSFSRADVQAFVESRQIQIQEVERSEAGEQIERERQQAQREHARLHFEVTRLAAEAGLPRPDVAPLPARLESGRVTVQSLPESVRASAQAFVDVAAKLRAMPAPPDVPRPKYARSELNVPGGTNYKEILLTLPKPKRPLDAGREGAQWEVFDPRDGVTVAAFDSEAEAAAYVETRPTLDYANASDTTLDGTVFTGSHWDEPNVLAHVRMDDREINGKRTLFVQEIQADWHQQGRVFGYRPHVPSELDALAKEEAEITAKPTTPEGEARLVAIRRRTENLRRGRSVPDAPFKGSAWAELILKRVLAYASEHGYAAVSWTPGSVQQERYDLSKHVDTVSWTPMPVLGEKMGVLVGYKNHAEVVNKQIHASEIADHIGKDPAEKLLSAPKDIAGRHTIEGEDLKVGGEWAVNLYDKALRNIANAQGKKYGVKATTAQIKHETKLGARDYQGPSHNIADVRMVAADRELNSAVRSQLRAVIDLMGDGMSFEEAIAYQPDAAAEAMGGRLVKHSSAQDVHFLDLPQEMRASIRATGLPLFHGEKAAVEFTEGGEAVLHALSNPDASSGVHEIAHIARRFLFDRNLAPEDRLGITDEDIRIAEDSAGVKDGQWERPNEEWFARAFERYLRDGKSPSSKLDAIFAKFADWLTRIYQTLTGSAIDVKVSPEMRKVFDRLVTRSERIASGEEAAEGAKPAETADPVIRESDLPFSVAQQAHAGTSWTPEDRAVGEQRRYVAHMRSVWSSLSQLAKTPEQKTIARAEFDRYRQNWLSRYKAVLGRRAGLVSAMIAGPSKFPARQQSKRGDSYGKGLNEFLEWDKRAQQAMRKAVAPTMRAISADRDDAVELLQQKIDEAVKLQETMKRANAILRGKGTDADKIARIIAETGLSEKTATKVATEKDYAGRVGFPDYALQNNNANIKRMQQRIAAIQQTRGSAVLSATFEGGRVEENADNNRLQVFFDGKPDEAMRAKLKSRGFKWAPSEGAWQRQRGPNATAAIEQILGVKLTAPQTEAAPADDATAEFAAPGADEIPADPADPDGADVLYQADHLTDSPAFRRWFGESKVVDEQGQPLRVFHGTSNPTFTNFARRGGMGGRLGFWFASTPEAADQFARERDAGQGPAVYPVYLAVQNPMEYQGWSEFVAAVEPFRKGGTIERGVEGLRRSLMAHGHDGIVIRGSDTDSGGVRDDWAVFRPEQIKSATGNRGTFDPDSPNILFQEDDPAQSRPSAKTVTKKELESFAKLLGEAPEALVAQAEAAGFTVTTEDAGKAGNINLDKLAISDEAKNLIREIVAKNDDFIEQRRGRRSWAETVAAGEAIPRPERVPDPGKAFNAEELDSLATHVATATTRLMELTEEVAEGSASKKAEFSQRLAETMVVAETFSGGTAEAGRALNILKRIKQARMSDDDRLLDAALRELGNGTDIDQIAGALRSFAKADRIGKYKFVRGLNRPDLQDVFWYWVYTSMLSGPLTHMRNLLGNTSQLAFATARMPVAVLTDYVHHLRTGDPRTAYLGEISPSVYGMLAGSKEGLAKALFMLREGFTLDDVAAADFRHKEVRLPEFIRKRISQQASDRADIAINLVSRSLEAGDLFFRSIRASSELYAQAYVYARNQHLAPGSDAFARVMEEFITKPPKRALKAIQREASRAVLRDEPGKVLRAILQARQIPVIRWIVPFAQAPGKIMLRGVEASPAGFYLARKAKTQGQLTQREIAQLQASGTLGTTLLLPLASMVAMGLVSGSGPDDRELRAQLYRQGWQPNSIFLPGVGWVSYQMFQPLAFPLAVLANAREAYLYEGAVPNPGTIVAKTINSVLDASYLQGLSRLMSALQQPERWGAALLEQNVNTLIGFAGLRGQIARAIDPTFRDPDTMGEALKAHTPVLSRDVRPRLDVFGEESERGGTVLTRMFLPVQISGLKGTPLEAELLRLRNDVQISFPYPGKKVTINRTEYTLTADEYAEFLKETGQRIKQQLERRVADRGWMSRTDDAKAREIKAIVDAERDRARPALYRKVLERAKQESSALVGASR